MLDVFEALKVDKSLVTGTHGCRGRWKLIVTVLVRFSNFPWPELVPDDWRIVKVMLIFKRDSMVQPGNCKMVSLISVEVKLLVKNLRDRINLHVH